MLSIIAIKRILQSNSHWSLGSIHFIIIIIFFFENENMRHTKTNQAF